jgi:hypothetical protein
MVEHSGLELTFIQQASENHTSRDAPQDECIKAIVSNDISLLSLFH